MKDYCDRCQEFIEQIEIGVFGCPLCKCDDSIITFYKSGEDD
jgi:hypothetical protein